VTSLVVRLSLSAIFSFVNLPFESDEFHSATAKTVQEAQKLVEAGFEPSTRNLFNPLSILYFGEQI
jgi:hypothetical protein